jgi:hypothetical protein
MSFPGLWQDMANIAVPSDVSISCIYWMNTDRLALPYLKKPPLWAELMFMESEAILTTMLGLMDQGIPSLSVHDSLIVPQRHKTTATELLRASYEATTKAIPFIRCKLP